MTSPTVRFPVRSRRLPAGARAWCVLLTTVTLAACGSSLPTERNAAVTPALRLISGPATSDTAEAPAGAPLVVELRDSAGRPMAGVQVDFTASQALSPWGNRLPTVLFQSSPGVSGAALGAVVATTDSTGRASTFVRLWAIAGEGAVVVTAPTQGRADTVRFTIRPGNAVRVRALPADTAVYLSGTLALRSAVVDQYGNPTSAPVTHTALGAGVFVTAAGVVTGHAPGRAAVVARSGAWADTGYVTVVPVVGTIAVSVRPTFVGDTAGVGVVNLDGSGYHRLATTLGANSYRDGQQWTADGGALVVQNVPVPVSSPGLRLWRVPLDGSAPQRLLAAGPAGGEESPAPSRDGHWIYYVGLAPEYSGGPAGVRRVHGDGSGDEALPPATPADLIAPSEVAPAISPDGTMLAWVALPLRYDGTTASSWLEVRTISTGTRTPLHLAGSSPAWSPDGTRLAYVGANSVSGFQGPGPLRTVRPDGSDDQQLVVDGQYQGQVTWSPDGRWLVAQRVDGSYPAFELIEVATGARYALPFLRYATMPAWRPQAAAR